MGSSFWSYTRRDVAPCQSIRVGLCPDSCIHRDILLLVLGIILLQLDRAEEVDLATRDRLFPFHRLYRRMASSSRTAVTNHSQHLRRHDQRAFYSADARIHFRRWYIRGALQGCPTPNLRPPQEPDNSTNETGYIIERSSTSSTTNFVAIGGVDANVLRLIWAAFSIFSGGAGALIYALVGFTLPEEEIAYGKSTEAQSIKVVDSSVTVM